MIETQRLKLREIRLEDSKAIFKYRSDQITNQYQSWIPKNLDEVDNFIGKNPTEFNKTGTWFQLVIEEIEKEQIIGDIGIHFVDDYQCEIGFTLDKDFQGKGLASEAVMGVINHLFKVLDKHRISASVDPENLKSIALLNRVGFRKEGHFKESYLMNGIWVDDVVFGLLKSEWI